MSTRPVAQFPRSGSRNSSKQLAFAAVRGSLISFKPVDMEPVSGYLVGIDDYHYVVAVPDQTSAKITLIHKQCPFVSIGNNSDLENASIPTREFVSLVGSSFLALMREEYSMKQEIDSGL